MMQGILPETTSVDSAVAFRTSDKVWDNWGDARIRD
jgi:hypothetical protein